MENNYTRIFIINSISDYESLRLEFSDVTNSLFITTHSTIDIFIRAKNEKVVYKSIFDFITEKDAKENLHKSMYDLSRDLNKLDAGIQIELVKHFDAKVELYSAFLYLGTLVLYSIKNLEMMLTDILATHTCQKLVFCEKQFNDLLPLDLSISTLFKEKLQGKNIQYEFKYYAVRRQKHSQPALFEFILSKKQLFKKKIKQVAGFLFPGKKAAQPFFSGYINVYDYLVNDKKKVLADSGIKGISSVYMKEDGTTFPVFDFLFEPYFNLLSSSLGPNDYTYRVFLFSYHQLISSSAAEVLKKVWFLQNYLKTNKITCGIWDIPPIEFNEHPIVFSYLRNKNISVYGIQHGAAYVDQYYPLHQFCDFKNCTHYISYGFDQQDIQAVYPDPILELPKILPYGDIYDKHKNEKTAGTKLSCDLVFPMTNYLGLFDGGDARILPNTLLKRQYDILRILNKMENKKIIVKPFVLNNIHFNYLKYWKKEFKNLIFIDTVTYKEFLKRYEPAAVLIEFPSTPIYETLDVDTEIFLMSDPIIPYNDQALSLLVKRIHYVKDIQELVMELEKWNVKSLPKKRSNAYYDHYVYKAGALESFLNEISSCEEKMVSEALS